MLFGLDGVELSLIIVFFCLFMGIMTGYPVAFAIGGSAVISFGIIAVLANAGILQKEIVDTASEAYREIVASGVPKHDITIFKFPQLPTELVPLFERGVDGAFFRTIAFVVNRMNERVLAGPSIETLLAVAMFVLMGIALERSKIANDLLTTMARVFGPLPGGLAVSVVVVGAFLAASTGIVGATVVTMGLLSLPTMLRNGYSPQLSTGVIAASGTLGQIIPPSIVIVLLGTLAGDLYATAQEKRAKLAGCTDALTYLGEPAVLSVGTLFQAAVIPGIMLAVMYAAFAFGYALFNPTKAPPVTFDDEVTGTPTSVQHKLFWFLGVPAIGLLLIGAAGTLGVAGSQTISANGNASLSDQGLLRTNVSDQCKASLIELHGQERWDRSVAAKAAGVAAEKADENLDQAEVVKIAATLPPLSMVLLVGLFFISLVLTTTYALFPGDVPVPLIVGGVGVVGAILVDALLVQPITSPGWTFLYQAIPFGAILYGLRYAMPKLAEIDLLRVVFPPLILIVAVLGSILGGITNPTPAAALGAAGALMLAAHRKLSEDGDGRGRFILMSTFAIVIFLLFGTNFDLRTGVSNIGFENWVAIIISVIAYHLAFGGLIYSCFVLAGKKILAPVVRETAKVTSMVFAILIGSQMLNLVVISFGGEHYIQEFLLSFEREWVVFLIVMMVLFFLGFVLDFLEIIYIVIPIVGPVIYGGSLDPKWVTIMIAINLQTSFLTPPFGFALFYLRGVAPPSVTTAHIYRGVIPFVLIQVVGLAVLWMWPSIVTILPDLMK
ncbi:MAG: TRAP transporter large permease subunit [Stappiaceae bacterium]